MGRSTALRTRKIGRCPFLVFYLDRANHIDLWRVLHLQRDIPVRLQDTDE